MCYTPFTSAARRGSPAAQLPTRVSVLGTSPTAGAPDSPVSSGRRRDADRGGALNRPGEGIPVIAVVPARAGSKGVPRKNVRLLAGRPLYSYAVHQALDAGVDRVIVTTDIPDILTRDHGERVVAHRRPAELASDGAPMAAVLTDVIDHADCDRSIVVLLQPTSPLRSPADIAAAVGLYESAGCDLVMSVCEADRSVLKWGTLVDGKFAALGDQRYVFANRQELPKVYRPNGAIYVFAAEWLRRQRDLVTDSIAAYVMPAELSIDIDTEEDFEECERKIMGMKGKVDADRQA